MKVFLTTHPESPTHADTFREIARPLVTHKMGWGNLEVVESPQDANSVVMLTPRHVMNSLFPDFAKDQLSVCNMRSGNIWIHEDRWFRHIPDKSQLPLPAYRTYVLQHEIGHAFGKQHDKCTPPGPVPVMVQQTLGIGGCDPNPFPTQKELSDHRS